MMIQGRQPRAARTGVGFAPGLSLRLWGLVAIVLALAFVLTGCSGGSSSGSTPTIGGGVTGQTTLTGSLFDQYTSRNVVGATVTFVPSNGTAAQTVATDTNGSFTLSVPTGVSGKLSIQASGYYDTAYIRDANNNQVAFSLSNGTTVTATQLGSGSYSVGQITLLSTDGPPPPPQNL